jgi:membrane fusion protein, copper/silver efflux system
MSRPGFFAGAPTVPEACRGLRQARSPLITMALNRLILIIGVLLLAAFALYLLAPAFPGLSPRTGAGQQSDILHWTCPMHPSVRSPEPGACPLCGMDLTPVRRTPSPREGPEPMEGELCHDHDDHETAAHETEFHIDPTRRQLINVQTTEVQERVMEKEIRTVGRLQVDETRVEYVHSRVSGWIQEVFVNHNFQPVRKGAPLFTVYSPELVATQEEYLLALRTVDQLSSSPFEHISSGSRSLLNAARRRLELFNLTPEQIDRLEKTREIQRDVTIYSPASGNVVERRAYPNAYVTPDVNVYSIADHSRIWAQVEVYEHEIGQVSIGQQAEMRTAAYPGEIFRGRVVFIDPQLREQTRTLNVRLEFPNPGMRLKPEMYADVFLKIPLGRQLSVPESAVLRTGMRDIVFVDRGAGYMQLREITVGDRAAGHYAVLAGLSPGERVVTSGNFLVDAESKIQGIGASWDTPRPQEHVH